KAFFSFPAGHRSHTTPEICGDLLPGIQPITAHVSSSQPERQEAMACHSQPESAITGMTAFAHCSRGTFVRVSLKRRRAMHLTRLKEPIGLAVVLLVAVVFATNLRSLENVQGECSAGKPYCYGTPVHLDPTINTPGFEGGPSLSADGLELYFVSDRPGALGGPGDQDIYVTRRTSVNENWGAPERVPPPVSSTFFDITPRISLDGLELYFGSNRPGPFSPPWPDLWVSHRASVNDPWGEPVNLGPGVNTSLLEGLISVSPDQRTAFFGGVTSSFVFDIFMSTRGSTDE